MTTKLGVTLARGLGAAIPVLVVIGYGLFVCSPAGEAAGKHGLEVRLDPRVEIAALLGRLAGDDVTPWPGRVAGPPSGLAAQSSHPAVKRVRAWRRGGLTTESLAGLLLGRGPWPGLAPGAPLPADLPPGVVTPDAVDSLAAETRDFAATVGFEALWEDIRPALKKRADEIEDDPALQNLTARLADFFGEPTLRKAVIVPSYYGPWRSPFAVPGEGDEAVMVIDRASSAGKLTPETSLSWICVREFARPAVEKMTRTHQAKIAELSGYWDYLRQGVAASSMSGWEECFNAHLYRAIDLRVRPQDDGVERELRISSALQAGLGMIRALDLALTGYDRGRNFYRRLSDYFPTLLEEMAGLEARVRVERPRLGLKVQAVPGGLKISEIIPGHSAQSSELRAGDVIVEADGRPIVSEETLAQIVQSHRLGSVLKTVVERGGSRLPLDVTLGKGRIEYEFFKPERAQEPGR